MCNPAIFSLAHLFLKVMFTELHVVFMDETLTIIFNAIPVWVFLVQAVQWPMLTKSRVVYLPELWPFLSHEDTAHDWRVL